MRGRRVARRCAITYVPTAATCLTTSVPVSRCCISAHTARSRRTCATVAPGLCSVKKSRICWSLRRLVRVHFDTLQGPGNDFVPVMLYEHRSLTARQRTSLAELQVAYESTWTPVLQALHASGQLRAPVKLSRLLILGALNWSVQWFDPKKSASLQDLADAAVAMFLKES